MINNSLTTSSSKDSLQLKTSSKKLANFQKPRLSSFLKRVMRIESQIYLTLINNELVKARTKGVKSMS